MVTLQEIREKHQKLIQDKENKGGSKEGNDFALFNPGENFIRFLPGKRDPLTFYVEGAVHKITGPEGKKSNYQCRRPANESCPICDFYFDLWERHGALRLGKGVKSKYGDLAVTLKQKPRYYAIAVIRSLQEKGEDPVKYVAMSNELYDRVMAALTDPDMVDSDDPDNTTMISLDRGNDFNVIVEDKGGYTTFSSSKPKIKKTKAGTAAEIAEWVENKLNLDTLIKIGDYEEGKKIVAQLEAKLNARESSVSQKDSEDDNKIKFEKEMRV